MLKCHYCASTKVFATEKYPPSKVKYIRAFSTLPVVSFNLVLYADFVSRDMLSVWILLNLNGDFVDRSEFGRITRS